VRASLCEQKTKTQRHSSQAARCFDFKRHDLPHMTVSAQQSEKADIKASTILPLSIFPHISTLPKSRSRHDMERTSPPLFPQYQMPPCRSHGERLPPPFAQFLKVRAGLSMKRPRLPILRYQKYQGTYHGEDLAPSSFINTKTQQNPMHGEDSASPPYNQDHLSPWGAASQQKKTVNRTPMCRVVCKKVHITILPIEI